MTEVKWMEFIRLYWTAISYWEMIKGFRSQELRGCFFSLSALACRNSLLWGIAKFIELCNRADGKVEFGDEATETLNLLTQLYNKGQKKNSNDLNYEACGVGQFRDKELAHPLNALKGVLGKDAYKITLEWDTVEETLMKMKLFADQVEVYHREKGTWNVSTFKDGIPDVEFVFGDLSKDLEAAQKYAELVRAIQMSEGSVKVKLNYETKRVEIASGC